MNVISIGYGRHLFDEKNPEHKRMELCAKAAGSYDMIIFTHRSDGFSATKKDTGLTLHPTHSSSKLTMMFDAFKIATKIIKNKDSLPIVTTQDPFETGVIGYFLKKKFGVHLTVQEHADAYSKNYWKEESILNQIRYRVGIFILRQADTVRVVSERIAQTLSDNYVQKDRITKLPVAIDVDPFINAHADLTIRDRFPEDSFLFLSVARFVPQKNFPLLIQAFFKVYKKNPKARLLLVGTGPKEEEIKKQIASIFKSIPKEKCPIKILPWSKDVPGLMKTADAYVLSSNYEGWARVLIESMCSGLPVVTTDVGCANEVVKNGEHGYVVTVNNEQELVNTMSIISQDKATYQRLKENLQRIDIDNLPGTNISDYGHAWVSTLK